MFAVSLFISKIIFKPSLFFRLFLRGRDEFSQNKLVILINKGRKFLTKQILKEIKHRHSCSHLQKATLVSFIQL